MPTSIVIPVHGKLALTAECLGRLRPTVEGLNDVEVIVVDDGSPDATHDVLRDEYPWVKLVAHQTPQGFATACNSGAAAADGELILFFNNDLAGEPGWFEALLSHSGSNDGAAVIGCKLLYPDQTIQHAGIVVCGDLLPRHVYRLFPRDHHAVSRSRRFQAVTGACLLVRASLFQDLGGFDSAFVNGFEDVDLCLRAGEAGAEVHYCAESALVHFEAATRGEDSETFGQNAKLFLSKWGDVVKQDDIETYVNDGLLTISQGDVYPLELHVDPLLASIDAEGALADAFRLLGIRSRQVFDLLKENTLLRVRLGDVEFEEAKRALEPKAAEVRPFES
jgi:GT2 family glycosyltransferase